MNRTGRSRWNGDRPASSVYDVWSFLSTQLRHSADKLRKIDLRFYGESNRSEFLENIFISLKTLTNCHNSPSSVYSIQTLQGVTSSTSRMETNKIKQARTDISAFISTIRDVLPQMKSVKWELCQQVLQHLEDYCYDYRKLGTADDDFYKHLKGRIVRMKEILTNFDKVIFGLQNNCLYFKHFCDEQFSEEVAITFDCEKYPILRACPDLIQKLYVACDIAQDWLRSDKVYVEEMEKQIEQTKLNIKSKEEELSLLKLEYSKIFSSLKQRQNDDEFSDDAEENTEETKKSLSRLETSKYRLQMEIIAVSKLLANCRDNLRLRGLRSTASPTPTVHVQPDSDEVDGCNPERVGLASSRYRERVSTDSKIYSNKLHDMKHKLQKLYLKIRKKHDNLRHKESANAEVQRLTRKLKSVAKKKSQVHVECQVSNDHLRELEIMLLKRKYPRPQWRRRRSPCDVDKTDSSLSMCDLDVSVGSSDRKEATMSADLRGAFRLVKNNIGFGWKDLARTLPYTPHKGLAEINNDIKAIEHENAGHLKEQCYQCLLRWFNHNGSHASLRDLNEALREIDENRIADKIQGSHDSDVRSSVESSPRDNDA